MATAIGLVTVLYAIVLAAAGVAVFFSAFAYVVHLLFVAPFFERRNKPCNPK